MLSRPAAPTESINGTPSSSSIAQRTATGWLYSHRNVQLQQHAKHGTTLSSSSTTGKYRQSLPSVPQYTEAGRPAGESVSYAIGPKLPEETYYHPCHPCGSAYAAKKEAAN